MYGCPTTFFVLHCHGKDDLVSRPRSPTDYNLPYRRRNPGYTHAIAESTDGVAQRNQIKRSDTFVLARRCTGKRLLPCFLQADI